MLTDAWPTLSLEEGVVKFRYGRREDVDKIVDMATEAIVSSIPSRKSWLLGYTKQMRRREFESLRLNWYSHSKNVKVVLAELNGRIVGYMVIMLGVKGSATAYPHLWISDLFVLPEYRRKGIGKTFLSIAEMIARRAGYDYVGLTVTTENVGAIRLYERMGYVEERKIMVKELDTAKRKRLR